MCTNSWRQFAMQNKNLRCDIPLIYQLQCRNKCCSHLFLQCRLNFARWCLIVEGLQRKLPSCKNSGSENFEVGPMFLENVCTPVLKVPGLHQHSAVNVYLHYLNYKNNLALWNRRRKWWSLFIPFWAVRRNTICHCTALKNRPVSLLLHRASCRFTKYHTNNKCINCMSFILNHFFKTLFTASTCFDSISLIIIREHI